MASHKVWAIRNTLKVGAPVFFLFRVIAYDPVARTEHEHYSTKLRELTKINKLLFSPRTSLRFEMAKHYF